MAVKAEWVSANPEPITSRLSVINRDNHGGFRVLWWLRSTMRFTGWAKAYAAECKQPSISPHMTRPPISSASSQAMGLLGWLLVTFAAAAIGGFASASASELYRILVRPSWAPPGWLFGPVWSVLYALMGVAAWLVWRARGFRGARNALLVFVIQLAANALWTWLFFVWRQGGLAFAEILVLLALILATIVSFWRINRLAAVLLLPYLLWVSFASVLTLSTWQLNPELLG